MQRLWNSWDSSWHSYMDCQCCKQQLNFLCHSASSKLYRSTRLYAPYFSPAHEMHSFSLILYVIEKKVSLFCMFYFPIPNSISFYERFLKQFSCVFLRFLCFYNKFKKKHFQMVCSHFLFVLCFCCFLIPVSDLFESLN